MGGIGCGPLDPEECRKMSERIRAACQSYSEAARANAEKTEWGVLPGGFVPDQWYRISPGDDGNAKVDPCDEPDYSCNGVEVSEPASPSYLETYLETMGFTYQTEHRIAYSITRETLPDLMAAIRDIARGS